MRSLPASLGVLGVVVLLSGAPATAQDFSGTYQLSGGNSPITLTLRQARSGQITGTLQGNTAFRVQARARGGRFSGYASNQSGRIYLQGHFAGDRLQVAMAEVGSDGQPQLGTARTVTMERVQALGQAPPAGKGKTIGPAPAPAPGVPAPAPRGATARADPFAGSFAGDGITLTLARSGDLYTGSATSEGEQYRVRAQVSGSMLIGVYEGSGGQLPFQAVVQGEVMQLAAGGETHTLRRQGEGRGLAGAGGVRGGAGPTASTGEERQIAQLLTGNQWCTMTYSGVVGSTSGTTRYERLVFRADGTGTRRTSTEWSNANDAGAAAGQGSGGSEFVWRLDGSVLVSSTDGGASWARTPMRFSRNSNGYPIITANGKDYAICD
jgi:hypothetical protein